MFLTLCTKTLCTISASTTSSKTVRCLYTQLLFLRGIVSTVFYVQSRFLWANFKWWEYIVSSNYFLLVRFLKNLGRWWSALDQIKLPASPPPSERLSFYARGLKHAAREGGLCGPRCFSGISKWLTFSLPGALKNDAGKLLNQNWMMLSAVFVPVVALQTKFLLSTEFLWYLGSVAKTSTHALPISSRKHAIGFLVKDLGVPKAFHALDSSLHSCSEVAAKSRNIQVAILQWQWSPAETFLRNCKREKAKNKLLQT